MDKKSYISLNDDDAVYYIYPEQVQYLNEENKLKTIKEKLDAINKEGVLLCSDYFWHNDSFEISAQNILGDLPLRFCGTLNYGENVEDEWFLVYVLLQLTLRFEDLIIQIADSDGEFLLIEAAEELPSWVSPETCEGRVFLHRGHLHILPQSFLPRDEERDESFQVSEEVLTFIRTQPNESIVEPSVEQAIWNRIGGYPDKLPSLLHEAVVFVPMAVASLLERDPHLVTAAVRAFCERDLSDLKACRAMKYFPPEQRVLSRVIFTKCSYAMLVSSNYQPDKRTGWNLPLPSHECYKAHLQGMKLACGFEILLTQEKRTKSEGGNEFEDSDWLKMKARLENFNYFRGLLEHSKEYNELLNSAQEFHKLHCQKYCKKKGAGARIKDLMETLEINVEELKRKEATLSFEPADESWMEVSKEELDGMLAARFGGGSNMVDVPSEHPREVSHHLKTFISHVSGVDGAEFPNKEKDEEIAPIRPARGFKNKKRKNVQFSADTKMHSVTSSDQIAALPNNRVTIEPDAFIHAVQNILDFSIPDDNYWDSDGSGMSSYEDEDDIDLSTLSSSKENQMASYIKAMDQELSSTTIGQSFVKRAPKAKEKKSGESNADGEEFEPVDIDMNALKNIIMSYKTQMGEPGPAENMLGPMGVNLEDIDADVD